MKILKLVFEKHEKESDRVFAYIFTGEALVRVPIYCACSQAHPEIEKMFSEELKDLLVQP